MRVVATIISDNAEDHIGGAVASVVDHVDDVLLVDTGITDNTIVEATRAAGSKLVVERFAWVDDFASARNFALDAATKLGADWALTLDTDERLVFHNPKLHLPPNDTDVDVWLMYCAGLHYTRERLIRLPTKARWSGRVHEALINAGIHKVLPWCIVSDVPKDVGQFTNKLMRDLRILREDTSNHPENPRWWYYLGQTLEGLHEDRLAIDAYEKCAELEGWAEECAWACYKAASLLCGLGDYSTAIDACAAGLAKQAGSPELAWMSALCRYRLGDYREAVTWAKLAVAMGAYGGMDAGKDRIGFRHLPAWYHLPYDVLRFAYQKLGMVEEGARAERDFIRAGRSCEGHGT